MFKLRFFEDYGIEHQDRYLTREEAERHLRHEGYAGHAEVVEAPDGPVPFGFTGHRRPARFCLNQQPHPPHACGTYRTVRYGELCEFCPGIPGDTPAGRLTIAVESERRGGPDTPARTAGHWSLEAVEPAR